MFHPRGAKQTRTVDHAGQAVQVGEAIGIIAAQSIGEPGTQLTRKLPEQQDTKYSIHALLFSIDLQLNPDRTIHITGCLRMLCEHPGKRTELSL